MVMSHLHSLSSLGLATIFLGLVYAMHRAVIKTTLSTRFIYKAAALFLVLISTSQVFMAARLVAAGSFCKIAAAAVGCSIFIFFLVFPNKYRRLIWNLTHELEEQIREEKFQTLAQAMPLMVWSVGPKGPPLTYCNDLWQDYTGVEVTPTRKPDRSVVHPDDTEALRKWEECLRTGKSYQSNIRFRRKDGAYRWHLSKANPLYQRGKIVGWVGGAVDIDDQIHAQQVLQDALKSKDDFFSIASHELRTPITALKMQVQMLRYGIQKQNFDTDRVLHGLASADFQTDRLVKLIDNLLDVTRIKNNKLSIDRSGLINLTHIVESVASRLHDVAKSSGCRITLELEKNVSGYWDSMRVEQLVTNLVSNAVKYGDKKPIHLSLHSQQNCAVLKVRDQGIGIAPEDRGRIFNKFERTASATNFSGLGLGLYISNQIALAHGGSISVTNNESKGSVFTLTLPMGKPAHEDFDSGRRAATV